MERQTWPAVPALAAFVFLSSYLGLTGRFFFVAPADGFAFMAGIWADSVAADVVFTAGSVAAALAGWHFAARHPLLGALAGAAASWVVYTASFLLLEETRGDVGAFGLLDAAWFVVAWGFAGLLFSAIAPPAARWWWTRRQEADAPVDVTA